MPAVKDAPRFIQPDMFHRETLLVSTPAREYEPTLAFNQKWVDSSVDLLSVQRPAQSLLDRILTDKIPSNAVGSRFYTQLLSELRLENLDKDVVRALHEIRTPVKLPHSEERDQQWERLLNNRKTIDWVVSKCVSPELESSVKIPTNKSLQTSEGRTQAGYAWLLLLREVVSLGYELREGNVEAAKKILQTGIADMESEAIGWRGAIHGHFSRSMIFIREALSIPEPKAFGDSIIRKPHPEPS